MLSIRMKPTIARSEGTGPAPMRFSPLASPSPPFTPIELWEDATPSDVGDRAIFYEDLFAGVEKSWVRHSCVNPIQMSLFLPFGNVTLIGGGRRAGAEPMRSAAPDRRRRRSSTGAVSHDQGRSHDPRAASRPPGSGQNPSTTGGSDRLVKELRLAGAATLAEGNALLPAFMVDNARFAKPPGHRVGLPHLRQVASGLPSRDCREQTARCRACLHPRAAAASRA